MTPSLFDLSQVGYAVSDRAILSPISLTLLDNRVYGLIGPNGSGKSTLLRLLARQIQPTTGAAQYCGQPLAAWNDRDFARQVAYMPQFTPSADGMTVRELVSLGRFPWHGSLGRFTGKDRAMVDLAMAQTGLDGLANRSVDSLSGGERQRAWLALMLAQNARCLLLDEPTSALDIGHQATILALVRQLSRTNGISVIVILHDINLAARYCDHLIALRQGNLVTHGQTCHIVSPDLLADIYGVGMGVFSHPLSGEPVSYLL